MAMHLSAESIPGQDDPDFDVRVMRRKSGRARPKSAGSTQDVREIFTSEDDIVDALDQVVMEADMDALSLPDDDFGPYDEEQECCCVKIQAQIRCWLACRGVKRIKHRRYIIEELLDTERSYVRVLKNLDKWYHKPLMASLNRTPILSKKEIRTIFTGVGDMLEEHQSLLDHMTERLHRQYFGTCIGDLFNTLCLRLAEVYTEYINNFESQSFTLKEAREKNQAFVRFLGGKRDFHGHRDDIADLLIAPVQRIPRYLLLLEQIRKYTPRWHPDFQLLSVALLDIRKLASIVNERKRMAEKMAMLEESMIGFTDRLSRPDRFLVMRVDVLDTKRKDRCLFLFTDCLIMATPKRKKTTLDRRLVARLTERDTSTTDTDSQMTDSTGPGTTSSFDNVPGERELFEFKWSMDIKDIDAHPTDPIFPKASPRYIKNKSNAAAADIMDGCRIVNWYLWKDKDKAQLHFFFIDTSVRDQFVDEIKKARHRYMIRHAEQGEREGSMMSGILKKAHRRSMMVGGSGPANGNGTSCSSTPGAGGAASTQVLPSTPPLEEEDEDQEGEPATRRMPSPRAPGSSSDYNLIEEGEERGDVYPMSPQIARRVMTKNMIPSVNTSMESPLSDYGPLSPTLSPRVGDDDAPNVDRAPTVKKSGITSPGLRRKLSKLIRAASNENTADRSHSPKGPNNRRSSVDSCAPSIALSEVATTTASNGNTVTILSPRGNIRPAAIHDALLKELDLRLEKERKALQALEKYRGLVKGKALQDIEVQMGSCHKAIQRLEAEREAVLRQRDHAAQMTSKPMRTVNEQEV
eukprot:Clim_evm67s33 gene=Clim_evmTU67s33